jgi:hypothetical protein
VASRIGKKIDTWRWRKTGITPIEIPVHMRSIDLSHKEFVAHLIKFNIYEHDTDIEALRSRVFKILDSRHSINWTRQFLVKYSGNHSVMTRTGDGDGFRVEDYEDWKQEDLDRPGRLFHESMQFELEVSEIELGVYTNGEKCWRHVNSAQVQPGWPHEEGPGQRHNSRWDDPEVQSCVPATDENRHALHELFQAFAKMDGKLMEMLGQKNLQLALERILQGQGALALPAPEKTHVQPTARQAGRKSRPGKRRS